MTDPFADLHAPIIPILRHALTTTLLPRDGWVLDLAAGAGEKLPLLAEAFGSGVRFITLDKAIYDLRSTIYDLTSTHPFTPSPLHPFTPSPLHPLAADAHALPLRDETLTAVCCIAAIGLFDDPAVVLGEVRRVLRCGGLALVVTGSQRWAQTTRWPADLATLIRAAYADALHNGALPLPAPDVGDDLAALLRAAEFDAPLVRAFLLDAPIPAAEITLLPWAALRALVAPRLDATTLARCDIEQARDVELCSVALLATASR